MGFNQIMQMAERLSNVCGDVSAMIGIMSVGRMLVAEAPSP
jgi:hypothetical protein